MSGRGSNVQLHPTDGLPLSILTWAVPEHGKEGQNLGAYDGLKIKLRDCGNVAAKGALALSIL